MHLIKLKWHSALAPIRIHKSIISKSRISNKKSHIHKANSNFLLEKYASHSWQVSNAYGLCIVVLRLHLNVMQRRIRSCGHKNVIIYNIPSNVQCIICLRAFIFFSCVISLCFLGKFNKNPTAQEIRWKKNSRMRIEKS